MNDIWWQTTGEGNCHLVLLHGWGLNANVWDCITPELATHFTLHLVDLPGYGRSGGFGAFACLICYTFYSGVDWEGEPGGAAAPATRAGAGDRRFFAVFWRARPVAGD